MASGSEYEKIVYIYNTSLASMVQDLVNSYQLLLDDKFLAVQSSDATEDELKLFHSNSYIEFLNKVNNADCLEQFDDEQQAFGLGYDCPILDKNLQLVKTIAGGSISAAKILAGNKYKTAINWFGGWHHAQRGWRFKMLLYAAIKL
ncbi:hypothetical protein NQ317_003063 [Molorchus minor]|uniref:histone deacetylase n=1 Tax=Molorchus minor TaxID=1323400 RepID=A0ABQ9ITS5_9CUCU|nr:hypothetical protein NQ317_003063 [Molorchus minor]